MIKAWFSYAADLPGTCRICGSVNIYRRHIICPSIHHRLACEVVLSSTSQASRRLMSGTDYVSVINVPGSVASVRAWSWRSANSNSNALVWCNVWRFEGKRLIFSSFFRSIPLIFRRTYMEANIRFREKDFQEKGWLRKVWVGDRSRRPCGLGVNYVGECVTRASGWHTGEKRFF